MPPSQDLARRPEAKTESVEDLVAMVVRGEVRIPVFQRGLTWKANNVLELFDSIYRGFPIGSLLFRRGPAQAGPLKIGPLEVFGVETSRALWVVDGQQRLTSLAAGMVRASHGSIPASDVYVVYFDAETQSFQAPPSDGSIPSTWVPLPRLLNGSELSEWVFSWKHGQDASLRAAVFEAGRRLREFKAPVYVIDTDDEAVLRAIFHRVNNSGQPLSWKEVHDALYGHKGSEPSSLSELATQLEELGMGRPDEDSQLLPSLVAFRGLDVTRSFGEHIRADPTVLDGAVVAAAPALREVLSFLRTLAEIPHLRLLPYTAPLVVLTRFFREHPESNSRTKTLLVRWIWRSFLGPTLDDRTLRRKGVAAITDDEEASVQSLLQLVGSSDPLFQVDSFDARSAHSRISMLGLLSARPLFLGGILDEEIHPVDIPSLLREVDREAFRPLFSLTGSESTKSEANRILLPGRGNAEKELREFIAQQGFDHPALRSHAISIRGARAIFEGRVEEAVVERAAQMGTLVAGLGDRLGGWGRSDRPSIEYLLANLGDE